MLSENKKKKKFNRREFVMSVNADSPMNIQAVATVDKIIKYVAYSVAEQKVGVLFINSSQAVSRQKNVRRTGSQATVNTNLN